MQKNYIGEYEAWLADLWRPFGSSEGISTSCNTTIDANASQSITDSTSNNNSPIAPCPSLPPVASTSSSTPTEMPIRTSPDTRKAARVHPWLGPSTGCKCPNGGGKKPIRHWRTKCPYNPSRHDEFTCDLCGRPFNRLDNLKRHRGLVHPNAEPSTLF